MSRRFDPGIISLSLDNMSELDSHIYAEGSPHAYRRSRSPRASCSVPDSKRLGDEELRSVGRAN